jgi:hypothetical protein
MKVRYAIGIGGLVLIVVGIWGLGGWAWAAIAAGLPTGGFYLWGEVQAVRGPVREGGS